MFIPLSEDVVDNKLIISTGKCNIACFVVKLTKTICNSLVLFLPTKMGTKKILDRQVSLKQPEVSNLPMAVFVKILGAPKTRIWVRVRKNGQVRQEKFSRCAKIYLSVPKYLRTALYFKAWL